MAKASKRQRKEEVVNNRLSKNEKSINNIDEKVRKLEKSYDEHIIQHIIDDLCAETFLGSGRPLYTYKNIANRYNTSTFIISRIAEQNGLSRRGNKIG